MTNNKFSIIMPTFNDSKTIIEAIESIVNQKYTDWELVIVNDGSQDDTEVNVKEFIKNKNLHNKIKYIYQANQGQLQSIKNAIPYINGDVVYILHSDDVFYDEYVLENANNFFKINDCDGIICREIPTFNKNSQILTGSLHVKKYSQSKTSLAKLLINNGSNLYMDMAFVKKDVFIKEYFYNYLEWNRPFWCNIENKSLLKIKSVKFKFFRYRVFEENYIQSDIGKLVQINGELRVMIDLFKFYQIPSYKLQNFLYRAFSKFKLDYFYMPIKKDRESTPEMVYKNISCFIQRKLANTDCVNHKFIQGLIEFYKQHKKHAIDLTQYSLKEFDIKGSDIRSFILKDNNEVANRIIDHMRDGFDEVIVSSHDYEYAVNILHFLCILPYVKITVK